MSKKTVLVTGSDGYLGTALTLRLLEKECGVVGVDNILRREMVKEMGSFSAFPIYDIFKKARELKKIGSFAFFYSDITNYDELANIFKKYKPDIVVNLAQQPSAPYSHISREHAVKTIVNNSVGTMNILYCMKEFTPNSPLVTIGSMGEFQVDINTDIAEGLFEFEYNGRKSKSSIFPRRAGSFYHACYSHDTEILTENGWKLFKDIDKNEKVATLNKEKDELQYQVPINYFEYDFIGELIHLKNKCTDLLITENHNLFEHKNYKSDLENWRLSKAIDCFGKNICMRRNVKNWEGDDPEYFVLPSCKVKTTGNHSEHNGFKIEQPKYIEIDKWIKFFGWYITEGFTYKNSVIICQQNENNFDDIKDSLSIFDRKIQVNRAHGIIKGFSIKNVQLSKYMKQFGLSGKKFIPKWIKNLTKPLLQILFNTMIKGDGHLDDKSKKTHGTYYTKSRQLANDFHEICLKLGYSATFHKIDRQENEYCVYISENKTTQIIPNNRKHSPWNKIAYSGKVYCVEVPNDIIMVRRNGKSTWCGNSKIASTYYIDCAVRFWGLSATDIMQGVVYGNWTEEIEKTKIHTRLDSCESFGTVINRFIVQAMIEHPLTVYGKGLHKRGFLALNDSIQCLMLAIENPPKKGEYRTWNQLDEVFTIDQLADKVISVGKEFNMNVKKIYIESPRVEVVDDHYYNPIAEKIIKLGFKQTRTVEDEIRYLFKVLSDVPDLKKLGSVVIPKITWR